MRRMHRPDPRRAPDLQDKRSVVPIALADVDAWLAAPREEAAPLVRLAPAEDFDATPAGA
jgi:putative SOS response-associated peptidase YedK